MPDAGGPVLSIIIPTFNRERYVISTVEQVLAQDFQEFELYVIDQSDIERQRVVEAGLRHHVDSGRVNYIRLDTPGVANARNEGLSRVHGDVIMFLDDDVVLLSKGFLRAHLDCYEDAGVGGVGGRTVERINRENTRRTANRITRGGRTLVNLLGQERCEIHSLKGANMSVRASAIAGMGGFDRNYSGTALLEEADFSERILQRGWRFLFEPKAELLHLSAPAGGVRVPVGKQTDFFRFRSTAYFMAKHRGRSGLVSFTLTHVIVAATRATKTRDLGLLLRAYRGARQGLKCLRDGVDQDLR